MRRVVNLTRRRTGATPWSRVIVGYGPDTVLVVWLGRTKATGEQYETSDLDGATGAGHLWQPYVNQRADRRNVVQLHDVPRQ